MYIKEYNASEDLARIQLLLTLRAMDPHLAADLPKVGFLAYDADQVVAAAFLRHCGANTAIFDGLITDPAAASELRDNALDAVVSALTKKAKELGLKALVAWTDDENTKLRAQRHGFQQLPHAVIVLDLSK